MNIEQRPLLAIRQRGFGQMFQFRHRRDGLQVVEDGLIGKVEFEEPGRKIATNVSPLDLQRRAIFRMDDKYMQYSLAIRQLQKLGQGTGCVNRLGLNRPRSMHPASLSNRFANIMHLDQRRAGAWLANEGPQTLNPGDHAIARKLSQSSVHGHTRD